jgi:hypothetical protein
MLLVDAGNSNAQTELARCSMQLKWREICQAKGCYSRTSGNTSIAVISLKMVPMATEQSRG